MFIVYCFISLRGANAVVPVDKFKAQQKGRMVCNCLFQKDGYSFLIFRSIDRKLKFDDLVCSFVVETPSARVWREHVLRHKIIRS
jgi:hypothetical protein